MASKSSNKIVFFVGPSAVGKSSLALELAQKMKASIVNADSLQVYTPLNIGTAKPSLEERSLCPHLLFDIAEPPETLTAGDYRRHAIATIEEELKRSHLFFVGGSGFYLQALKKGMFPVPEIDEARRQSWQERLKNEGLAPLHEELKAKDPEWAQKISPQDSYRTLRALMLMEQAGRKLSDIQREFEADSKNNFPYPSLTIGLKRSREDLREQVIQRTHAMLKAGLVEEVETLIQQGWADWSPLDSVGYKESKAYLAGRLSKEHLPEEIVRTTMGLAKKQMTWFRRDSETHWFDASLREAASDCVRQFLAD